MFEGKLVEVAEGAEAFQQTSFGARMTRRPANALHVEALRAAGSHICDAGRLQGPRVRFPEVAHDVAVPMRLLRSHLQQLVQKEHETHVRCCTLWGQRGTPLRSPAAASPKRHLGASIESVL